MWQCIQDRKRSAPPLMRGFMSLETLKAQALDIWTVVLGWLTSPQFYAQVAGILFAVVAARFAASIVRTKVALFREEPKEGPALKVRRWIYLCRDLLFPLIVAFFMAGAVQVVSAAFGSAWLVRLAQSAAVVFVLYAAINRFIAHPLINAACRWVGLPVAGLAVFGVLDEATAWLDSIAFAAGNIRVSLYALVKAAIFGGILFWFGRMSNDAGQKAIRKQEALDAPTRELFSKLFEIALYFAVFVLLLQILGLDLTALTVFGGALGVGLGFGLQQIAANFISGIIILLERSLKVGDYVELEGGKAGLLTELNMRSSTLATFDGKEIMVPNEKFITTSFVNWTHSDPHQRYEIRFIVDYDTDMRKVPEAVEAAVAAHPGVLKEPEAPSCAMLDFAENGVQFGVQFWVGGLDEGKTAFSSAVRFRVWDALKEAGIAMARPPVEMRMAGEAAKRKAAK
jgi:small-conductance mechanosensitive channel